MALNFQQSGSELVRRVLLIVLLVVSLVLTTVYSREGDSGVLHSIQGAVSVMASPAQYVGATVGSTVESAGDSIADSSADEATLTALREQNRELRQLLAAADEYRIEAERLQALLNVQTENKVQGVAAQVVGRSIEAWNQSVTIDKGESDGISSGMTVMGTSGVIGQVVSVTSNQATVRLLTDPNSGAAVMVQSSRANGIVRGSFEGLLYLEDISEDQIPAVGDVIITSGLGGSYTSGLMVGTVVSVAKTSTNATGRIVVNPNDDAKQLENVVVVLGESNGSSSAGGSDAGGSNSSTSSANSSASAGSASASSNAN